MQDKSVLVELVCRAIHNPHVAVHQAREPSASFSTGIHLTPQAIALAFWADRRSLRKPLLQDSLQTVAAAQGRDAHE